MNARARSAFITAATALALRHGGMTLCSGDIKALRVALDDFPFASPGDEIGPTHGRARDVLSAWRAGDEDVFSAAHYALRIELAAFWSLRARAFVGGGAA